MNSYILFIYGLFNGHDDIENFCLEVFDKKLLVGELRYVIENSQNIIIIFDSKMEVSDLSKNLKEILDIEKVKFYFMFEKNTITTAHIPQLMKDFIFKPKNNEKMLFIEHTLNETNDEKFDLDSILEKIEKKGIDSLTKDEKNFLDNF